MRIMISMMSCLVAVLVLCDEKRERKGAEGEVSASSSSHHELCACVSLVSCELHTRQVVSLGRGTLRHTPE